MTSKFWHLALVAAGAVLAVGSLSACGDDSTASAPITQNAVTTTSMYTSAGASAEESASASAAPSESKDADKPESDAAGSSLPATAPNSKTKVPTNFPGPEGQALDEKSKRYLSALKQQNITFMGDSDNSVAITIAEYVCNERRKNTDPVTVKAFVTALVGPGTKSVGEANTKADRVIKAAGENYC